MSRKFVIHVRVTVKDHNGRTLYTGKRRVNTEREPIHIAGDFATASYRKAVLAEAHLEAHADQKEEC